MGKLRKKIIFAIEEAAHESGSIESWCWEHDLNKATISNFINHKTDVRLGTLEKICDALDLTIDVHKNT